MQIEIEDLNSKSNLGTNKVFQYQNFKSPKVGDQKDLLTVNESNGPNPRIMTPNSQGIINLPHSEIQSYHLDDTGGLYELDEIPDHSTHRYSEDQPVTV